MPANNETRIIKTNTFEDWRQKDNEISFELGDVDQLDSRILDKNHSWTASADQSIFQDVAHRFEIAPEQVTDINVIIFTGLSSIPSNFVAGNTVTQSGGFSGKILWINKNKVALELTSGTFNAGQNLAQGGQNIPHANIVRQIVESVKVGYARVKVEGTEITQSQIQAGWHAASYNLKITLTGTPTIPSTFTEGATLYQGSVGSESFTGTLLYADSSYLYFKTHTGTFNTSIMVKQSETAGDRITAGGLNAATAADTSFLQLIELHTQSSADDVVLLIANSAVLAINEVQDDIGDITSLGTTNKADLVTAINELETAARGSTANYTISTTSNDLVGAINEHDAELGTITSVAMGTGAATVSGAIAELENEIDVLNARVEPTQAFAGTFSASTVMDALNEHEGDIGNMTFTGLAATDISAALREVRVDIGNVGNSGATLTTGTNIAATDLTAAVVELDGTIGSGVITGSGTEAVGAGSLTTAVNLLNTALGDSDSYNDGTYGANTIAGTLDLLQAGMIANDTDIAARLIKTSGSSQALATDLTFGGNKTYTVSSGSTLDVSNGTLLLPGNASGVNTFSVSFLNVDGNQTSTGMGMRVDRAHIGGSPTPYPAVQWRESQIGASKGHRGWQIVGTNAAGSSSVTSDLVTFYNAEDLISSNTESGIAVTWDSTNQNFDFNVNDFTITLGGDLTGNVTITDLASATLTATVAANSVALGTDTTGNYMSGISGTANEITVTHTPGEGSSATIALPDDVTIGNNLVVTDYARAAGLRVGTSGADPGDNNMAVAGNAEVGGNLTVTGNFTVNGTTTTLSTTNLEVEDTLILAGSDLGSTEPSTGGFGLETKVFAGVHSNAAAGVTGAHSLVYNFATDRWEADGSLVLSAATVGSPDVAAEGSASLALTQSRRLHFNAGAGTSTSASLSSNDIDITVNNTDRGSAQLFYKTFTADSGSNAVASANNDTIDIEGGTLISTASSADKITVNHANVSRSNTSASDDGTYVKGITTNSQGHITAVDSGDFDDYYFTRSSFASNNTASAPVQRDGSGNFSAGVITANLTGTASNATSATNATNSTKVYVAGASGNASYRLVFTETNDTTSTNKSIFQDTGASLYYNPSTNVLTSGTFSGSHSGNGSSLTSLNASNISSGTISDARLPASISSDITGNAASSTTVSINYNNNSNASYQMLWGSGTSVYGTAGVTVNPSSNVVTATTFSGALSGNATSATNCFVGNTEGNGNYRLVFVDNDSSANQTESLHKTSGIYVNAQNEAIYATTFHGSLSGTATVASTVQMNTSGSSLAYRMVFTNPDDTAGSKSLYKDSAANFYYNPSTNTLVVPSITATLSGSSTSCTGTAANATKLQVNDSESNSNYGFLGAGGTGSQHIYMDQGNIYFNPSTNTITASSFAGTATNVTMNHSDGNASYPIVWRSGNTAYYTDEIYLNASSNYVYATDFIASSDDRLKNRVGTLDNALDKVCAIDGFLYTWNEESPHEDKDTVHAGVSAQQVQKVLPEAVEEGNNGYLGVKYDKLVPLLIESIKELKAEIEELKSINR